MASACTHVAKMSPNTSFSSPAQIVYYDGQMNDARVNIALATTAAMAGAAVANHVSVVSLTKASLNALAAPRRLRRADVAHRVSGLRRSRSGRNVPRRAVW